MSKRDSISMSGIDCHFEKAQQAAKDMAKNAEDSFEKWFEGWVEWHKDYGMLPVPGELPSKKEELRAAYLAGSRCDRDYL